MKRVIIIVLMLMSSSCTYLRSVSQTSIPEKKGKAVQAETYKFIFLGLNFDNSFADRSREKLIQQCPDGDIKGILTKAEDIVYFPIIAHAKNVVVRGYCNEK